MNMSGNYSGYYQPFGPPMPPFGPPNGPYRPSYPPNAGRDFNPSYPPNRPRPPQQFAEYSLWGDSGPFDCLPLPNYKQAPPRPTYPPRLEDHNSFPYRDDFRPPFLQQQDDEFRPSVSHRPFAQRPASKSSFSLLIEEENQPMSPRILSPPRARSTNAVKPFSCRTEKPKVFSQRPNSKAPFPTPNKDFKELPPAKVSPRPQTTDFQPEPPVESNEVSMKVKSEDDEFKKPKPVEEEEQDKVVIEKEALYRHPDNFLFEEEMDFSNQTDMEQSSNSSGSSGDWTNSNFKRAGDQPACRPSRALNSRGRKGNVMQRRLVRALAQPVKMDKGASMLQRMGWIGGGLGKDGGGIVDPIAPNAFYATTTVGFGQEIEAIQRLPTKKQNRSPCVKRQRSKQLTKEHFKTNLLLHLLQFVRNDLVQEIYFEEKLTSGERKRIHRVVAALQGTDDSGIQLTAQQNIVDDILRRNRYMLCTESEGDGANRSICVYKEAPNHMYLVTPDDCRPCNTDINQVEEESNPFLASITKHIKEDAEPAAAPPYLMDKLIEFFIEFTAEDEYTEFRFLGPFTKKEIHVMSSFFSLIRALSSGLPPPRAAPRAAPRPAPRHLEQVFLSGHRYYHADNGSLSILKLHISEKEEYEKRREEERQKIIDSYSSYYPQNTYDNEEFC